MSEIELAWAAGFFDGEGTACCVIKPSIDGIHADWRKIAASVSQKEREPLDRFQKAVGFGKVYGPYTSKTSPYHWTTASVEGVQLLYDKLSPYLCTRKKQQLLAAIIKRGPKRKVGSHNEAFIERKKKHASL